ncbi:DUF5131 family protein [Amycolatopsis sp. NPDC058340]|uniref:DUF5131 family protein n=1 Tax=Amycolatopsis sp. NPDC058340 TaxID=3346453 RepID=UPI00365F164C
MSTGISWTDETWNPVVGCTPVSAGCDHCYAGTLAATRLKHLPLYADLTDGGQFNGKVKTVPERLDNPMRWRKPRRVFVNSMSDLFHDAVPLDFIVAVFARIWWNPHHQFQLLTKRHARMRAIMSEIEARLREMERDLALVDCPTPLVWPLPNLWLGVSVENQRWADIRIPVLLDTPAAVRWISAEPLLGPIDLVGGGTSQKYWLTGEPTWGPEYPEPTSPTGIPVRDLVTKPGLDWVVVGGESGKDARPMPAGWARSLRNQCEDAGIPFHFKQWGEWASLVRLANADGTGHTDPWADREPDAYVCERTGRVVDEATAEREVGSWTGVYRVGTKASGRELDRRIWDQYPAVTA